MGDQDDRAGADGQDRREKESGRAGVSPLEILASAAGLLLTLGILAFIGREALIEGDRAPPAIIVEQIGVSAAGAGWVVEVRARNLSSATAQNVEIEGEVSENGRVLATGRAELDFVPGDSSRRAGLFLPVDPRDHQLELRALGYAEP